MPRTGFIDHIGIGVPDLVAAKQYYDDLMSVLLLPSSDSADADAFTQRIRRALVAADASSLPAVHVSAGVAAAHAPANVETLLLRADSALYAAKRAGRNQTVISEREEAQLAGLAASS